MSYIIGSTSDQPPLKPLPSSDSAMALVQGDFGALPTAVFHTVGRGLLLNVGMRLAGIDSKTALKASAAGAVAIEAFAILWFSTQRFCPPLVSA
jgi:hypothetical protein